MSKICMGCMNPFEEEYDVCPKCGYIEDTKVEESLHMEPGSILRDRYIVGRVLGFGGFGVTYLGWDATLEQKVAIKEYLPSEFSTRIPGQTQITVYTGDKAEQFADGLSNFVEEARRLAKFHSEEGIVRIFDSFEANNTAYIIMEYLEGETLAEYLKKENTIPVDQAIDMLLPVIKSLQSVNEQGIIHRDIAPDNIFLTKDGKIKLIDFGAARFATTTHSRSLTVIIKPGYSPEEQYRSRGDQGPYTDVYAIGATLYRMITGVAPPDALERRAHFESKKKDILKPINKFTSNFTENQETAILNAINIRVEDRTQDMATFAKELTTEEPEKVKRLYGKIKRIDVLKWPLWAKISTVAAMLAVATLSILFATGVIGFDALLQTNIEIPEGMSRVPSVVNRDLEEAESVLNNADLFLTIIGRDYSDEIPVDFVLLQDIDGGALVEVNTAIGITISGGEGGRIIPGLMPSVLFREEDEAVNMIEASELTVDVVFEYSETVAEGLVMIQYPDAGTSVPIGEQASITISAGLPPIEMPDVVGMSEEAAYELLFEFGFGITVEHETSEIVEEGYVISQDVNPDTIVRRGDRVVIIVSSGREIVEVVDVVGLSEEEAITALEEQGFEVVVREAYSETVAIGVVISQSPSADSSEYYGTEIIITVSVGPEPDLPAQGDSQTPPVGEGTPPPPTGNNPPISPPSGGSPAPSTPRPPAGNNPPTSPPTGGSSTPSTPRPPAGNNPPISPPTGGSSTPSTPRPPAGNNPPISPPTEGSPAPSTPPPPAGNNPPPAPPTPPASPPPVVPTATFSNMSVCLQGDDIRVTYTVSASRDITRTGVRSSLDPKGFVSQLSQPNRLSTHTFTVLTYSMWHDSGWSSFQDTFSWQPVVHIGNEGVFEGSWQTFTPSQLQSCQ